MGDRREFSRAHLLTLADLVAEAMARRGAPAHLEPLYRKIQSMLKADGETRRVVATLRRRGSIEPASYRISADGKSITCLRCALTSHNINDVREVYCGNCHHFHHDPTSWR
jgi:hypothetical protein